MSGELRVRSMNVADSEVRSVLGPAGNKARLVVSRKPVSKPLSSKVEKTPPSPKEVVAAAVDEKKPLSSPASPVAAKSPPLQSVTVPSVLRRHDQLLHTNFSPNASCSSDASSDSLQSRSSTGRIARSSGTVRRKKQLVSKAEKVAPEKQFESMQEKVVSDGVLDSPPSDTSQSKRRCAWVTPNTDPCYAAFHDEEWGVPVHDDKKLFELLVLSGALAELSWPTILSKRHIFREVFADFDPVAVSKLNEKKILATGSTASSLLSEPKLRAIIDNARQITKVIDEFGSFDKYIWSFVNHKPNISKFRYPRQVPAKTAKADFISKDLLKRGFRSVGATIIYSFMQVAGLTNDHLTSCFRFQECITAASANEVEINKAKAEAMKGENLMDLGLARDMDELSFSSE